MFCKSFNLLLSLLLAGGLLLSACAPAATSAPIAESPPEPTAESIQLTDYRGKTVTLETPAQRVISLAPSNTEILFAIGAGDQVVGRDTFSDYPPEAQGVTDIGGGFGDIDKETLLTLEPDLVLAADLTPPEQIESLEALGLAVYSLPNPTDYAGLYENLQIVGQLTGRQDEVDALVQDLKARVEAVAGKVAGVSERPLVFYELDVTDPNAPYTAGPGTFIDTLISTAGGENLGADLDGDWVQISVEALLTRNPDVIILGDYTWGGVTPEDVYARTGWDGLTAVQTQQVYPFDDNLVSRPGPRLVDGLEAMASFLHPDLFE
jgi:iron complex transport system substrate-binding protein